MRSSGRRIAAEPTIEADGTRTDGGLGQQRDSVHLRSLGFRGQVAKPIGQNALRRTLVSLGSEATGIAPGAKSKIRPLGTTVSEPHARILLAEDNAINQEVAGAVLKKLGFEVHLVANGNEAIQALCERDYDLVLMDCEMPELDGYEATERIRNGRTGVRNPLIPIIALTADALSGDRDRCLQRGMDDYLAKPAEPRQLAEVINKWLAAARIEAGRGLLPIQDVFDGEDLLARLLNERTLAAKIVAGFLNDFPRQLATLKKRLISGDAPGARLQAHALKGAAATVSAKALSAACGEAQRAAADGDLTRASALLARMDQQFEMLKTALEQQGWG